MCGFVCIYEFTGKHVDPGLLGRMRDSMIHRGPDDEGIYVSGQVGLGFRRLSIIDLASGRQPMSNDDGTVWVVFNGEIYNYLELRERLIAEGVVFRTKSDTETIIRLYERYGEDCVLYMNGMFSFAIWDERKKKLFAARDRVGIKPFYYYKDEERLIIASEIKAIVAHPDIKRLPNYEAILDYLQYMYCLGDKTFFQGIRKLMPGYTMTADQTGNLHQQPYWDLFFQSDSKMTERDAVDLLSEALRDSMRLHLRSDVPLGCHLSGGLDSSTVTSLARSLLGRDVTIDTFSGKFSEDPFYDETEYAKIVAREAGTRYHEIVPAVDQVAEAIETMAWIMDEPAVGPGIIPQFFVSRAARSHVKVVLGGQGGDELFGGYPRYFLASGIQTQQQGTAASSGNRWRFLLHYIQKKGIRSTVRKALRYAQTQSDTVENRWKFFSTTLHYDKNMIGGELAHAAQHYRNDDLFLQYFRKDNAQHAFDKMLYHDFKTYLPALLHVEDRTSMAVSLESRVPLLDYRIAELAAKIPVSLKVKNGDPKYILKQAVKNVVPFEIVNRKDKKGFPTPVNEWFKGQLNEYMRTSLLGKTSVDRGIFNEVYLRNSLAKNEDNSWELWCLLNVELWFRKYID